VTLIAIGLAVLLVAACVARFRLRRYLEERDYRAWRRHTEAAMRLVKEGRR